jgi:hypothetical protein
MKSPSQIAIECELKRLKVDVVAHHRQMDSLWSGDPDMLRLLRAEESVLSDEIARLKRELRTSKHQWVRGDLTG